MNNPPHSKLQWKRKLCRNEPCRTESYHAVEKRHNTRACCDVPECSALTSLFVQQGKETQLLHVFEEDLILGSEKADDYLQDSGRISLSLIVLVVFCAVSWRLVLCSVPSRTLFSARFFLVVLEITESSRSMLHMWHLQLDAVPVVMGL